MIKINVEFYSYSTIITHKGSNNHWTADKYQEAFKNPTETAKNIHNIIYLVSDNGGRDMVVYLRL